MSTLAKIGWTINCFLWVIGAIAIWNGWLQSTPSSHAWAELFVGLNSWMIVLYASGDS